MLKNWRKQAGLTQSELAKKLGWRYHSFVQKAEIAERRVDAIETIRWCQACDVDPLEGLEALVKIVRR